MSGTDRTSESRYRSRQENERRSISQVPEVCGVFGNDGSDLSTVTHGNLSSRKIAFCGANGVGSSSDAIVTSIVVRIFAVLEKQMRAATCGKRTNPIRIRDFARFTFCHDEIFARHRSPLHVRRARASPAIDAMTIDQRNWPALQHVSCPAANASASDLHILFLNKTKLLTRQCQLRILGAEVSGHLVSGLIATILRSNEKRKAIQNSECD